MSDELHIDPIDPPQVPFGELVLLDNLMRVCLLLSKQETERCLSYLKQWNDKRPASAT